MTEYNQAAIRQLIQDALTNDDFEDLVQDHFPNVHRQFTTGQTKGQKTRILLEYTNKYGETERLLSLIQEINPKRYEEYAATLGGHSEPPNPPENKTCDILVLAANTISTQPLALEAEIKLIQNRLQEGEIGRKYVVKAEKVAYIEDISRYLLEYQPIILHFSGHGNANGEIIFNSRQGAAQAFSIERLGELLSVLQVRLECVVLNACFSLEKADALAEQVSCIIGMDKEIDDESARIFAGGFYRGLGYGRGYYTAFELGRQEIKNLNLPDDAVPHFITRDTTILQLETAKPRITRSSTLESVSEIPVYPLWFGTNRKPINPQNIAQGFSAQRDYQLHYGTCQVAVPKSHQIGSIGSPWWERLKKMNDDRLKLKSETLRILEREVFFAQVRDALQQSDRGSKEALVFIHGFNVSFEAAALRAAQIGFDLQVSGIMAFYSWPSQGKLMGYNADEATIFLISLAQQKEIEKIHIIAHSMGNRGLLRAMQRILSQAQATSKITFGQIFLAAPDVDIDVFRSLANTYHQLADRTTLYISGRDKALATSGIIHNYPRLGFFPPVTVIDGIDTVEVSNIDLTFLGHGYFAAARDLLHDIHRLLQHNTPPYERFGLRPASSGNQQYWIIGR